jgi:hypothetical protein
MVINNKLIVAIKAIPMIPLTCVSSLNWSSELGQKLRGARGDLSRQKVVEKLPEGLQRSTQWLGNLEEGKYQSVDLDALISVLTVLGFGLEYLYPVVSLDTTNLLKPENVSLFETE